METRLAAIAVRKPRDLVRARQQTRQLAALLGFDSRQQAVLTAEVFALLCRRWRRHLRPNLIFGVENHFLKVVIDDGQGNDRFTVALPDAVPNALDDVAWMMSELNRRAPINVIEEMEMQNRELLALANSWDAVSEPSKRVWPQINESAA